MLADVMHFRTAGAAALLGLAVLALLGCTPSTPISTQASDQAAQSELQGTLSVFAAASLQPAFEPLGEAFTKAHPGVTFTFTFDGSSVLATQLLEGAQADVFASADEAKMRKITSAGLARGKASGFASSELMIAVAPGNPLGIKTLADLARATAQGSDPTVVLCDTEVPCGRAAKTLLERDGVSFKPASREQNVTAVLTKVRSGEADAGLVYVSDVVRANGEVDGIDIAGAEAAAGSYVVAPLKAAASPEAAAAFADFLHSDEAQMLLRKLGFGPA